MRTLTAQFHKRCLVQADGRGQREAFGVGLQQRITVGGDRVVDGVPITAQLGGNIRHCPAPADMVSPPLRVHLQQTAPRKDLNLRQKPQLAKAFPTRITLTCGNTAAGDFRSGTVAPFLASLWPLGFKTQQGPELTFPLVRAECSSGDRI